MLMPTDIQEFRKKTYPICQANKLFNKVFGIGANKTGTTSLMRVFELVGLNVAPQSEGELTAQSLSKGNFVQIISYIDKYDAFQDVPFSVKSYYAQFDALYPNSKFILTVRDQDKWFDSFLNHHKKCFKLQGDLIPTLHDFYGNDYLYDGFRQFKFETDWLIEVNSSLNVNRNWGNAFNKDIFTNLYLQRNISIVRHFSERPNDLLIIDITKEKTTEKIVHFLGLPPTLITPMPHLNKR